MKQIIHILFIFILFTFSVASYAQTPCPATKHLFYDQGKWQLDASVAKGWHVHGYGPAQAGDQVTFFYATWMQKHHSFPITPKGTKQSAMGIQFCRYKVVGKTSSLVSMEHKVSHPDKRWIELSPRTTLIQLICAANKPEDCY